MNTNQEKTVNRREFLKGVVRNLLLMAFLVVGWTFGKRTLFGEGADKASEQILGPNNLPCGTCSQSQGCLFVQAKAEPECPTVKRSKNE